jgi:hypothetical protein
MAQLADEIPGFAGIHFDENQPNENQQLVIELTSTGNLQQARTRLGEHFLARARGNTARMAVRQQHLDESTSHLAKYNFRELHTWYGEIVEKVLSIEGVTSSDIDESQNLIVIGVTDSETMAKVQTALRHVAAPRDAIHIKSGIQPATLAIDLRNYVRPVVAGVQLYNAGYCTLGYNVNHPEDGYWYFLTNSHCTSEYGGVHGDFFGQPDAAHPIGREAADPPTFTHAQDSRCPNYECRFSDAALIRYSTSSYRHGYIALPNIGSRDFTTSVAINAAADPVQYQLVYKVGRTTGHTGGLVRRMCENRFGSDGIWRLCSVVADYVADVGDSGSPVFTNYSGVVTARGIHWGRETGSNPIEVFFSPHSAWDAELRADFGGTYSVVYVPPLNGYIDGPDEVSPMISCTWYAAPSGGTPPYKNFQWSGVLSGTNNYVSGQVWSSGYLNLTFKDSGTPQQTKSTSKWIESDWNGPPSCEG